jgi:hypothetical protein
VALATAICLGLFLLYHPMILSGMRRIQADTDDPRLLNYFLEHSYQWVQQSRNHRDYWDMPFFYPTRNTAAFSDTLLSVAPVYWVYRSVGFAPDTSFQIWMLTVAAVNFLAGYWLLRGGLKIGCPGSICGAFLFAFAAVRANQVEHQQLEPQVYLIISIMALIKIFTEPTPSPWRSTTRWSAAGLGLAAAIYCSFYLGWFLALSVGFAGLWAVILPSFRPTLLRTIRQQWLAILVALLLTTVVLYPLFSRYLLVAALVGMRDYYREVQMSIPDIACWFYMGPDSWVWGWLSGFGSFSGISLEQARRCGFGVITPFLCVAGLTLHGNGAIARICGLSAISLVCAVTRFERPLADAVAMAFWFLFIHDLCRVESLLAPRERWIMLALGLLVAVSVFGYPLSVLPVLLTVGAGVGFLRVATRYRGHVRVGIQATAVVYPLLASHAHVLMTPLVAIGLIAIVGVARWRLSPGPARPGAWAPVVIFVCALLWLFRGDINCWPLVTRVVPGAQALRVVSRGLLLVLIPASMGLGYLVDRTWKEFPRWRWMVCGVLLGCIIEQAITTTSFDKFEKRASIARVAERVKPGIRAFYYSPRDPVLAINQYHLDAMWAEFSTGVPTINGYSGVNPPSWQPLYDAGIRRGIIPVGLERALGDWAAENGLRRDEIWWIGGPRDDGRRQIADDPKPGAATPP